MLKHLFSPVQVGNMQLKNRLVMSPMGVNFGVEDGIVTEQLWEYLAARAAGGTGMILVGGACVHPSGLDAPKLPHIWDDRCIPALKKMADRIHQYDTKFGMQILHGGRQACVPDKIAPSSIPSLAVFTEVPKAMTLDEIKEIVDAFGEGARRSREAGFDFVEIHAAHGYLVNQFLARNSNIREDEYGGSFENRIRFILEVMASIKKKAGDDFPIGIRLNGDDYCENGWTLDETLKLAPILEKNGAVYLHITAGIYGSYRMSIPSMYEEQGCFVPMSEAVRKMVNIPVIAVGRIKDPVMADRIIKEGKADMVTMGRAHLADPDIAAKALEGNLDDIRPCLGCCLGCIHQVFLLSEASCLMNPAVGREYILKDQAFETSTPKKIIVVGAGPAGLASARLAALRGHNVVIVEEKGHMGGMLTLAAAAPKRSEFMDLVRYYQRELNRLKVPVKLNTPLTPELIDEIDPDVAIVATGSQPEIPQREGLLDTEMQTSTATDIIERTVAAGDRVLVLGGGQIALQTADYLCEQGKEVYLVNTENHYATEMAGNDLYCLRDRLIKGKAKLFKKVQIKSFTDRGLIAEIRGEEVTLDGFDDLVLAEGMKSIRNPATMFKEKNIEVHIIGDAKGPRTLLEAQNEADEVGRTI